MQRAPVTLALVSAAFACGSAVPAGKATATFEAVAPPAPVSCAELMPPGPPGAPVRFQIQKADPARDVCVPGTSDGVGGLSLQTLHGDQPGGSHVWFVAPDASQFNAISLPAAILKGQADGFEGASWTAEPASAILAFDDRGHLVGDSGLQKSFPLLVADPRGGVVVANFPDTVHVGSVESYDASARLRWHVAARPARTGAWPSNEVIALGVDLRGNSLVVLGGKSALANEVRTGIWIDPLGNAGQAFVIGAISRGAGAAVFARVGQGFFIRQVTPSGAEWVGQIDALSSSVAPPPDWLILERDTLVQVIKNGAGYALFPSEGLAANRCQQQVSIFDASGRSCGSAQFPLGPDACVTAAITIGYDGTVIQQFPASMEEHAAVTTRTCTWQWWSGFFK
jgi:hypothetical protein